MHSTPVHEFHSQGDKICSDTLTTYSRTTFLLMIAGTGGASGSAGTIAGTGGASFTPPGRLREQEELPHAVQRRFVIGWTGSFFFFAHGHERGKCDAGLEQQGLQRRMELRSSSWHWLRGWTEKSEQVGVRGQEHFPLWYNGSWESLSPWERNSLSPPRPDPPAA